MKPTFDLERLRYLLYVRVIASLPVTHRRSTLEQSYKLGRKHIKASGDWIMSVCIPLALRSPRPQAFSRA